MAVPAERAVKYADRPAYGGRHRLADRQKQECPDNTQAIYPSNSHNRRLFHHVTLLAACAHFRVVSVRTEFDGGSTQRQLQKIKIDLIAGSTHHASTLR
jgi:hypothetical protein